MSDSVALTKAQRLARLSFLLYRHPRGLTVAEMARDCGVTHRTIQRDLRDLEATGVPLWDDGAEVPRYGVISGYYVPPVHLSFDDAVALYLAARLLAHHAEGYDPHIVQALAKLATILPEEIARHVQATVQDLLEQPEPLVVSVLGTLALGWASGRVVQIRHLSASGEAPATHELHPYSLEPSGVYNATYVIGYAADLGEVRTFKVERIREAKLLAERFEVPEAFDAAALLRQAWGIMYGGEVQEVVLRFVPDVLRRVKETRWHPSQELVELPDGGCELRLWVCHPVEMLYWIRGWGPQVVVLAPGWLRERVAREAREAAARYGGAP